MSKKLEQLANVAVVVSLVVCITAWVWYLQRPASRPDADLYEVGEPFPLAHVSPSATAPVLVIFINSHCVFCTNSMPFYRRLLSERDRRHANVRVVAVSLEPAASMAQYLAAHGLSVDRQVAAPDASSLRLRGTPTLLLLDQHRVVRRTWRGQLTASQEEDLLRRLLDTPPGS